jgi:hypothetical protein
MIQSSKLEKYQIVFTGKMTIIYSHSKHSQTQALIYYKNKLKPNLIRGIMRVYNRIFNATHQIIDTFF